MTKPWLVKVGVLFIKKRGCIVLTHPHIVCYGLHSEETQALMGATRLAFIGEIYSYYLVEFVFFSFIIPTRDASPPLELALGGSVE